MSKNHTYAALTCKHCNAHLSVDTENPTITCEYCGATYRTSDLFPTDKPTPESGSKTETDPFDPLGEPARGRGRTPEQKKRRIITVLVVLILTLLCVRCSVNVVSDSTSSSSTSTSSTTVTVPPSSSSSSDSASTSSSASSGDAFGGSGSTSSASSSSPSTSSAGSSVVITPATHKNPDAVTPAFKEQIDEFEVALNNCLQKVADGDTSMEPYLELVMILDEMDEIDENSLSAADRAYMRETLVHMASNIPAVMGSGFQLHLGSNLQNVIN